MFQGGINTESSALPTQDLHSLSDSSLRDKVTATLIREEAAESLLLSIQGDAELAALNQVLNRYKAQWWLKHLSWVGAHPAMYWREQLGDEIEAATSGKNSSSQRKKFSWWFFRSFDMSGEVKYSCSGSPLMFWKGRTAIEGFSGRLRAGPTGGPVSLALSGRRR